MAATRVDVSRSAFIPGVPHPMRSRCSSLTSAMNGPGPAPDPWCTSTLPSQPSASLGEPTDTSTDANPSPDRTFGLITTSTSVPGANGTPATWTSPRPWTVADVSYAFMTDLRHLVVHCTLH